MNIDRRAVGRTGIEVGPISLGCVTFGREIDQTASFQIMDYALDNGITLFDTAESYGGGNAKDYRRRVFGINDLREVSGESHSSEKIIGRWLRKRRCREHVLLQTKVTTNFTVPHFTEALDASLRRLQTDTIDFYLFHAFDPHTRLEQGLLAMTQAIKAGKVRAAGCSNFSADQLRQAITVSQKHSFARLEVTQPVYNLVARDIEKDIIPLCRAQQISVVTYSPLAAGFLAGKYSSNRSSVAKGSRFDIMPDHADDYFSERNFAVVEQLRKKAENTGIPMVRLALAWTLRNPDITSVLVGARSTSHVENALIAREMDLPDDWLSEMNGWI